MRKLLLAALLVFAHQAAALTIHATLDSFEGTDASINGGTPGGGIGTFSIVGGDALTPNLAFLQDAPTFEAICLEPQEFVTTGTTYIFDVVDLKDAPTNPGPMGALKATRFLEVMEISGFSRVEDITGAVPVSLAQIAAWEAAQELGPTFDVTAGSAILTGVGRPDVVLAQGLFDGTTGLEGYGLRNIGILGGPALRTVYRGQDFAVFRTTPVATPSVMALLGLGLFLLGRRIEKQA